jgi:hypothetical protein
MTREQEINERIAALDYRSPLAMLLAEDVKYFQLKLESERQIHVEEVLQINTQLAVLESVAKSMQDRVAVLETENSDLKARFLNAITEGPNTTDAGQVPASQEPSQGEEPAPVGGGAASGVEPVNGQEEPAN